MLLFTQCYRDSGLEGLVPMGAVFARDTYISWGDTDTLTEMLKVKHPDAAFIFNVRFEWWLIGHPDNNVWGCKLTGDAYKMSTEVTLMEPKEQPQIMGSKKVTVKKGWQLRCGLVQLEKETIT